MNKFRKSSIARLMSFLMAIAIFTTSCSDYIANEQLDSQSDKVLAQYSGFMSAEECATFKTTIDAVKSYVWQQRKNGVSPTRADIARFVYDYQVNKGIIAQPNVTEKENFANFVQNNSWTGDQEAIINKLIEENYFNTNVGNVLKEFKANFENVTSYSQAYTVIENMKTSTSLNTLSLQEKNAVLNALDGAEKSVCYQETSQNDVQTRGWCEECSWTLHWVALVISIVVTVVAWILAVVTLGLSTLVTSVVLFTVWTATWVLVCIWVWCDEQEPCPDGQSPVCEGSFAFDASIPACTRAPFAEGDFQFNGCIFSPVLSTGGCPPGSIKQGQSCLWECSDNDIPVRNSDGNWQLPFSCR